MLIQCAFVREKCIENHYRPGRGIGLKSDEDEDSTLGYISIENGSITVVAGGDGIQAATDVIIADGDFDITTGGGSSYSVGSDDSAKGIKATVSITIDEGDFDLNAADDAVHSNDTLGVNGGSFLISSADDGMHADTTLVINGGDIAMTKCYEGIESKDITINDGDIMVVSSDDGINGAGGNDSSGSPFPTSAGDNYLYIMGASSLSIRWVTVWM